MAQFDFCPKCGAMAKDGECQSCGYRIPGIYGQQPVNEQANYGLLENGQHTYSYVNPNSYVNPYMQTKQKDYMPLIIAGIVLVFVLCLSSIYGAYRVGQTILGSIHFPENTEYDQYSDWDYDDYGYDDYGYDDEAIENFLNHYGSYDSDLSDILAVNEEHFGSGEYTKLSVDPYVSDDPEAYEFDTYIDDQVDYTVSQTSWMYNNQNGKYDNDSMTLPHGLEMSGDYFVLSNTGLSNEAEINSLIYEMSVRAADLGEAAIYYSSPDEGTGVGVTGRSYVTYMDENVLSIAFYDTAYIVEDYYTNGETYSNIMSHIRSLNIDMKTGLVIKASETFDFGGEFVKTFKDRCLSQNGSPIDFFDSDKELETELTDDSTVFWVYTPLGLEVGVNRPGFAGWATGTFTDYEGFMKVY